MRAVQVGGGAHEVKPPIAVSKQKDSVRHNFISDHDSD